MKRTPTFLILFLSLSAALVTESIADTIAESLEKLTANDDICTATNTPEPVSALEVKYNKLKDQLAKSIFGLPILLNSKIGEQSIEGEAYAVLDAPIEAVDKMLSKTKHWCDLGILHVNVKACVYGKDEVLFYIGRRYFQEPVDAYPVLYQLKQHTDTGQHLNITLSAPGGPFGTSDYLMKLRAVPINKQQSFIHYEYSYKYGMLADLAMSTYLATLGRHKVGFTVTETNDKGNSIYIKGRQGVIERNIMRYIFAIQSLLKARNLPQADREQARLNFWYESIAKFPEQLVEETHDKYLENKKREINNQVTMQKTGMSPKALLEYQLNNNGG